MTLVESKRFFTTNLIVYGICNFIFYLLVFSFVYLIKKDAVDNSTWRLILPVAVIAAIITSTMPALNRSFIENIRLGKQKNYVFLSPVLSLFISLIYFISNVYYSWSIYLPDGILFNTFMYYLISSPIFSVVISYLQRMNE